MRPGWRKAALAVHLCVSLGWIGAAAAYVAVAIAAATRDADTIRASWVAMELIGWWVLVPLAVTAVLTGLLMAFGTPWGLFRHYWVTISLMLTLLAAAVLLLHMPDVSDRADRAAGAGAAELEDLGSDLFHSVSGLVLLVVVTVLNVYKPRGLTRYGWRRSNTGRRPGLGG